MIPWSKRQLSHFVFARRADNELDAEVLVIMKSSKEYGFRFLEMKYPDDPRIREG
jgi:hypothetical protein